MPPQAVPVITATPPPAPGAVPVQANDLRAPPVIIRSSIGLGVGYTDNPGNAPNTFSDFLIHPNGTTTVSFDTVRLQGQATGTVDYQKFARANEFDALNADLLAFGLGTIVQDHVFVDSRAEITQVSGAGGFGFASPNLIPNSQQTQAFLFSTTPIIREAVGNLLVGELRYNYTINSFQNGGLLTNSTQPGVTPAATPSSTTQNEATFTLGTGPRFTALTSKLTVDQTQLNSPSATNSITSQSAANSTQFRAYDDLQYQVNQKLSALGRIGYEDLRYPGQSSANVTGPIYSLGARYAPMLGNYLEVRYGRQDGINGINGNLNYQITAATSITASLSQSRTTSQQQLINNLNLAHLGPYGILVNRLTGVPIALTNLQIPFPLSSAFKDDNATFSILTTLGRNGFSVSAFLDNRTQLGSTTVTTPWGLAGSGSFWGVNLNWSRSLSPKLTSSVSVGYAGGDVGENKTLNGDALLAYSMNERLTATLHYQFINVSSNTTSSSITSSSFGIGSYHRNQIEVGLRRTF